MSEVYIDLVPEIHFEATRLSLILSKDTIFAEGYLPLNKVTLTVNLYKLIIKRNDIHLSIMSYLYTNVKNAYNFMR